jgi:hypothetical protein
MAHNYTFKEYSVVKCARVAELADALDLGSSVSRRGGSSPSTRTIILLFTALHNILCGRGSVVEHRLAKARVASSNLVVRSRFAPLAQLDRVFDFESKGREFESLRARQIS